MKRFLNKINIFVTSLYLTMRAGYSESLDHPYEKKCGAAWLYSCFFVGPIYLLITTSVMSYFSMYEIEARRHARMVTVILGTGGMTLFLTCLDVLIHNFAKYVFLAAAVPVAACVGLWEKATSFCNRVTEKRKLKNAWSLIDDGHDSTKTTIIPDGCQINERMFTKLARKVLKSQVGRDLSVQVTKGGFWEEFDILKSEVSEDKMSGWCVIKYTANQIVQIDKEHAVDTEKSIFIPVRFEFKAKPGFIRVKFSESDDLGSAEESEEHLVERMMFQLENYYDTDKQLEYCPTTDGMSKSPPADSHRDTFHLGDDTISSVDSLEEVSTEESVAENSKCIPV